MWCREHAVVRGLARVLLLKGKGPKRTGKREEAPPRIGVRRASAFSSAGATPAAACLFSPHPMRALARAASLLRRAAGSAPTTVALHHNHLPRGVGPCLAKVWTPSLFLPPP